MAMITCPECKHNISDKAEACPSCGFPIPREKKRSVLGDSRLGKLWHGEYSLRFSFWVLFFAVSLSINTFFARFPNVLLQFVLPPTTSSVTVITAGFLLYAAYLVVCATGVWRSAGRYQGLRPLAFAARSWVCLYTVCNLYLTTKYFMLPIWRLYQIYTMMD